MIHLKNDHCYYEYSLLNQETKSYAPNWLTDNATKFNSFDTNVNSSFLYTNASQINSYPYAGIINTYMGGGYVFKVQEMNKSYLELQLNLLKKQ